jgi:hypothetical protein
MQCSHGGQELCSWPPHLTTGVGGHSLYSLGQLPGLPERPSPSLTGGHTRILCTYTWRQQALRVLACGWIPPGLEEGISVAGASLGPESVTR